MYDAHVSCERIVARERLLFAAHGASNFLLPVVVNRVLVSSEVIWPREDGIARLARGRIDTGTYVGSSLGISRENSGGSHAVGGRVRRSR